jgi:signal transduction histidine kinase/ActR/RegA family two-component response regulator
VLQPNIVELDERARAESRMVEFHGQLPAITPGARALPVTASVAPIKEGARIIGVVVLLRDRSLEVEEAARQRDVEASVREAQRLQGIGLLASGVAHHFSSLWTAVANTIELARHELPENSSALDRLTRVDSLGERGIQLATQLLAFAGRSVSQPELFDVNRLVLDHVELLRVVLPPHAELTLALDERELTVFFDRGQLQQVLLNLVHNAGDALLESAGMITLSTTRTNVAETRHPLRGGVGLTEDDCVVLSVTDSGTGISADLLPHIFDPFFSTRGPTRGLGLAAVDGILRSHDAAIGVRSQIGRGSTFSVYFSTPRTTHSAPVSLRRTCRVLVVDDDSKVRTTLGAILTDWGAVPQLCASGLEAIATVSPNPSAYELVLIDLNMPGLSGIETLEQLRAVAPQLKLGLLSGYDDDSARAAFGDHGLTLYIQKPFSRGSVRDKLAETLERFACRDKSST